jgi:hypothetical protein
MSIAHSTMPSFAFDINGHKGPNKWGHDIFSFTIQGNRKNGIVKIGPVNRAVEKGGISASKMVEDMHK